MAAFGYQRENKAEDIAYKGGNLPDGVYKLEVDKIAFQKNKSTPNAEVAAITLKVREPDQYKGRLIFLNLNIKHPKENVEQSGKREMDRLLLALGFIENDPEDTDDMRGIDFFARVGEETPNPNKPHDPDWKPRNRIARYYFADENQPEVAIDPPKPKGRDAAPAGRGRGDDRDARRGGRDEARGGRDDGRGREDRGGRDEGRGRDDRGRDDRGSERGGRDEGRGGRDDGDRGAREDRGGDRGRDEGRGRDDNGGRSTHGADDDNRNAEGSESPWRRRERTDDIPY